LAPAHDLVSTDAYIPEDVSALKFHRSRSWDSFTYDELETGKAIIATARKLLAIIYDTLKHGWVFDDFTRFSRRDPLIPAGQAS
jgi:hypothetical protein